MQSLKRMHSANTNDSNLPIETQDAHWGLA
jgi:hypothetical protein